MNLWCFAEDGTPTLAEPAIIQQDIQPAETAPFQIGGGCIDVAGCERFLVAATAHPQT